MLAKKKVADWLLLLTEQHQPDFTECLAKLGETFPLLHELEVTPQDTIWHEEGNVAIHTNMVLEALYTLLQSSASHIKGERRQVLILSALLHDIAKPVVTRAKEIDGQRRIVAPRHEAIGMSYLASRLVDLPLPMQTIQTILALVGFHQMPKLLVVKNKGFSEYLNLALNADLEMLYWLEVADMRGRICPDQDIQIELLSLFKMFAQEYELWSVADPAESLLANISRYPTVEEQCFITAYTVRQMAFGEITVPEEAPIKFYQQAKHYGHFYIMCGASGSGKSSWIAKHLQGFTLVSLDELRGEINGRSASQKNRGQVLQAAKQKLKKALAAKENVVWDATNLRKDFRKILCDLGCDYGALVTLVVFQQGEVQLRQNNRARARVVPDEVITQQLKRLEWPSVTEAHRIQVIGEQGQVLWQKGTF
ncbi:AAA family ATPase [Pseudoalteromonas sp. Isolate6]|uniref:AAA family ATPase n=1 Tax=Pseudoalteromonas sp. Isolate6 TaxID=2908527 RepID=UPI001EFE78A3|nr:AAA family ATPase [Pseudoalteromonas sp. Isolate6]MCG9759101.1 AAA family ATPase [Pseudoalteromonas sp. Isolate6]